jgi:UPF0755 protein
VSDLWILGIGEDEEDEEPRRGRRSGRRQGGRRRRRRRGPFGALLSVLVIVALVAGIFYGGREVVSRFGATPDYTGQGEGTVTIEVKEGDSSSDIAVTLVKAGVVKSEKAFNDAARGDSRALSIQPGFYTLRRHMSGASAFALLLDPSSRAGHVTVPEGKTVDETLTLLSEKLGTPVDGLKAALRDSSALGLPRYAGGRAEGFLFPTTYDLPEDAKPVDILRRMVEAYKENVDQDELARGAQALHRSPYEVLIVASLVEKEGITDDFGKIARVLYNRLDKGMRLQLDSTVNYALHRNNIRVGAEQLAVDSPYNTYKVEGLPPTPISNPGLAAIEAALHPTPGGWLYFVKATKDGHSAFAVTLDEHNANVARARAAGVF